MKAWKPDYLVFDNEFCSTKPYDYYIRHKETVSRTLYLEALAARVSNRALHKSIAEVKASEAER